MPAFTATIAHQTVAAIALTGSAFTGLFGFSGLLTSAADVVAAGKPICAFDLADAQHAESTTFTLFSWAVLTNIRDARIAFETRLAGALTRTDTGPSGCDPCQTPAATNG